MPNTSATGGYLTPADSPAPVDLDKVLQKAVVGITGLPGSLVRPRWQPGNPKQPELNVNWCAIGVTLVTPDAGPAFVQVDDSTSESQRHTDIELLATFYGPDGLWYAEIFRDGLAIPQNSEALNNDHIAVVLCGEIRTVPELVNQQWINRYDVPARLRRAVSRNYPIFTILSAGTDFHVDRSK